MRRCYDSVLIAFSKYFSRYISHLQGLQSVDCPGITLDVDAFTHLSCVPALTQLSFTLSPALLEQITLSDLPLCFPNLRLLTSNSQFLDPVSRFLSRTQLPVIRDLNVFIEGYVSKQGHFTFFTNLQASNVGHIILRLRLCQVARSLLMYHSGNPPPVLCFEDLTPCMAFSNLRHMEIDLEWKVKLTSSELLVLASAWLHLEHFFINEEWGWKTPNGITPDGLLHLLQACPSLIVIAINIDTRGYHEFRSFPESLKSIELSTQACHRHR